MHTCLKKLKPTLIAIRNSFLRAFAGILIVVLCFYLYASGAAERDEITVNFTQNVHDGDTAMGGADAYSGTDGSTVVDYAFEYESIGVSKSNKDLRFRSPNSIIFYTNMNEQEVDVSDNKAMIITAGGSVGMGTTNPAGAQLHVNGTTRASNPISSYHAVTKQYVDDKLTATLGSCLWTNKRHYGDDQNDICNEYGADYVQVGIDAIKDHDYIRYNKIYCCKISF